MEMTLKRRPRRWFTGVRAVSTVASARVEGGAVGIINGRGALLPVSAALVGSMKPGTRWTITSNQAEPVLPSICAASP